MRADTCLLPVLAFTASCVGGAPYGMVPAQANDEDSYEPAIAAPDCRANNDGVIEKSEMPFVVDAVERIRVRTGPTPVDVDGHVGEDGTRRWDFSTPKPDSEPVGKLVLHTMEGQWFQPQFPLATYAGPLVPGGSILGALTVTDEGVKLYGSASASPDPGEGRTLLVYDTPVTLYPFPLQEGARVASTVRAQNAVLMGLTTALEDKYDVEVTGRGTLVLPDLVLENTLRVTLRLERTLVAGDMRQVTHVWVHECLGEVARVVSNAVPLNQGIPDSFTTAKEVWRLSL